MRRALVAAGLAAAALLAPAAATARPALESAAPHRVHGPEFGTSGGDEPFLVDLSEPNAFGVHIASLLTSLNLADTPPGQFIGRPIKENGEPLGPEVVWTREDSDVHNADAAMAASRDTGMAAWDEDEEEDVRMGDVFVRPFSTTTARPLADPEKVVTDASLQDVVALGDGFALIYENGALEGEQYGVLRLDADGVPQGDATPFGLPSDPTVYGDPGGERALIVSQTRGGHRFATIGPGGLVTKHPGRYLQGEGLEDVAPAPGSGWVVLSSTRRRLKVRPLSGAGEVGAATTVRAAGERFGGAEIAIGGRGRGLVTWGHRKPCKGIYGAPVDGRGKPQSRRATRLFAPRNCGRSGFLFGLELAASNGRRYLAGWTFANGDRGHRVFAGLAVRR